MRATRHERDENANPRNLKNRASKYGANGKRLIFFTIPISNFLPLQTQFAMIWHFLQA